MRFRARLRRNDFTVKAEGPSRKRIGKREYLKDAETKGLMRALNQHFENMVETPRIRVGKRQTVETLINEEALLLAHFLRNEQIFWAPRAPTYAR